MTEAETIAKGSFWILSSNLATKLISFIYTIIIARLLIVDDIGAFYLVLSILWLLYLFTDLGLVYALNRYVPYLIGRKEYGKLRNLVKLGYFGGGALTFIFAIILFFASPFIADFVKQPAITPILQMMSIWLVIKEIDDVSRGTLTGLKKIREARSLEVLQNFAKLAITLIAIYMIGATIDALTWGFLLSFVIILPIGIYYVLRDMKGWSRKEEEMSVGEQFGLGKEVVFFGIVITMINSMWVVIQYTDRIMISYLMDESVALEKIAIYSIALGLANLILIFSAAIGGIFFPVVSELYGKKELGKMNETLKTSMKWLVFLVTPFALIMIVFGKNLLELFYGGIYVNGAMVLLLFVIALVIRSVFSLPQLILAAMRRLDVELKAVIVAAISNVILNIIMIPVWGINGAAFASLISFVILSIMIFYYSNKIFSFRLPSEIYKPIIAGVISLILILLMKEPVMELIDGIIPAIHSMFSEGEILGELAEKMIKFVIFGVLFLLSVFVYFLILLLFRSFGKEELDILVSAMKRVRIPERYIGWTRSFLEAKWMPFHK